MTRKLRLLGECLLISNLPTGKALLRLVDITRLAERTNISKPSLVNLISKDAYLDYPLFHSLN